MTARSSQGATPSISSVPFSISWQDPAHKFVIEFQVRAMRVFEEALGSSSQNSVGVLLGSLTSGPSVGWCVVDVAPLAMGAAAALPASPVVLEQVRYWNSQTRISAVGLWLLDKNGLAVPQARDLVNLASCFDRPTPLALVRAEGTQMPDARVYLWSPADRILHPLGLRFPVNLHALTQRSFEPFIPHYLGGRQGAQQFLGEHGLNTAVPGAKSSDQPLSPPIHAPPTRGAWRFSVRKWAAACLAIALLAIAFKWNQLRNSSTRHVATSTLETTNSDENATDLGLDVTRRGSDLQIRWYRNSALIRAARAGVLHITDGDHVVDISMPVKQLLTGHIVYVPRSQDINISFGLITASGRVGENVRVIIPRVASSDADGVSGLRARAMIPSAPTVGTDAASSSSRNYEADPASARAESSKSVGSALALNRSQPQATFLLPATPARNPSSPNLNVRPPNPIHVGSLSSGHSSWDSFVATSVPALGQQALSATPPPVESASLSRPAEGLKVGQNDIREAVASQRVKPPVPKRTVPVAVPESMKRLLPRGTTIELRVLIDENGRITNVHTKPATGVEAYVANLASSTVRELWRFDPALLDGKPVPSEHVLRFKFRSGNQ